MSLPAPNEVLVGLPGYSAEKWPKLVSRDRLSPALSSLPVFGQRHTLQPMADYFLVERGKGPAWDRSRGRREQHDWDEHAAFMDGLAEEGFVVLGGPIGDGDGENTMLVIDASDEASVRARLAEDPWPEEMLTIESIRSWSIWLTRPEQP